MTEVLTQQTELTPAAVEAEIARWLALYGAAEVPLVHHLCDRFADTADRLALLGEDAAGHELRLTFAELRDASQHFAGVLRDLGVTKGDRVATMLPRGSELLIATVALWRLGAIEVPLFTAFGPQAAEYRIAHSGSVVVITDAANRPKIATALADGALADGTTVRVVTVAEDDQPDLAEGDVPFWGALRAARPVLTPEPLSGDDLLAVLYTSGTTGQPKGVMVPVRMLAGMEQLCRFTLDVREDDVYWNIADPAWALGLMAGVVGSWQLGKPVVWFNVPFSPETVYRLWEQYGVTNFVAAPTVFRALRAAGPDLSQRDRLRLRALSSGGETLNPQVIAWAEAHLGLPIHDVYGQSELCAIYVTNPHTPGLAAPLRPGAMGRTTPGFRAVLLDEHRREVGPGQVGEIAVDIQASPLYTFRGYWHDPAQTAARLSSDGRYFLTGDMAVQDADGYFTYDSRADDMIKSSGYRIGPFEVESALMGHPAVAEAAVVGKPEPLRGAIVKAFVVLRPGYEGTEALADELSQFVKRELAAHAYPREIDFLSELPKTSTGKVQRFRLRG